MLPGARTPPDRPLEERVAGEHIGAVDEQGQHAGGVAGGVQRLDHQGAGLDLVRGRHRAGGAGDEFAFERVDQDGNVGKLFAYGVELSHVIVVVVGEQDVGEGELSATAGTRAAAPPAPRRRS